jgi:predicted transglutaminase-like cysteine proteinase
MFGFRGQGKGLAVVAVLLGLSAPAHAGDENVLYASLGEATRAPIGWVEFCAENPRDCHGGASQPITLNFISL